MFLDFDSTNELAQRVKASETRVSKIIASDDNMCVNGQLNAYMGIGRRALHLICQSLAQSGNTGHQRFLDFPCGWGRVTRWLRAAFPQAEIDVSDIKPDAVSWNNEAFETTGFESKENFAEVVAPGNYDLIWVGSLLTHLDEGSATALIEFTTRNLAPNGLVLLTSHGRKAVYNGLHKRRALRAFPTEQDFRNTLNDYYDGKYAHKEFVNMPGYGMSFTPINWFDQQIQKYDDLTLVEFREKAWNNHQDLVVLKRSPISA